MDLLKTILVYMSLVFTTSVQNAPEPSYIPQEATVVPTAYVQAATPTPTPKPTPVPTINITPNPSYKTIQVGDNGDLVRQMQEKLAEYGYYEGEIDGRFGNQTRRAVEAFQYQHGLSADGIAGRNTLTVLYESPEIRRAPAADPTPAPTPETQLMVAITLAPTATSTPAPTFTPVQTVEVTATPEAAATQETIEPEPEPEFLPMDGWAIRIEGVEDSVTVKAEGQEALLPYTRGDALYLPLTDILACASMNVISSSSLEIDEFAFAIGDSIIRIAYTEDQTGSPTGMEAFKNNEPQILPMRDIRRVGETIYLPAASIEALTGIAATVDHTAHAVVMTMPVFHEE